MHLIKAVFISLQVFLKVRTGRKGEKETHRFEPFTEPFKSD